MGDAALSQDEIDSLLAGLDGGATAAPKGGPSGGGGGGGGGAGGQEAAAFKAILEGAVPSLSQNLSVFTSQAATLSSPSVDVVNRDAFLRDCPEEVLAVNVAFSGGLPGEHLYVLPKELAIAVASHANNEAGLSELDEMAIAAVQELLSNLTGTLVNTLSDKTGNRGIGSDVADGSFGPKAMARVPSGDMVRAVYQATIGDSSERLIELFSLPFVRDVVAASGGGPAGGMGAGMGANPMAGMGGMAPMGGMGGMGGGMPQMGGPQGGMPQMGGYGAPQGYPMQGYGAPMQAPMGYGGFGGQMNPPNVQPVQFGSLAMGTPGHESGNIGLIMDVSMEMTVELGRTRKLIKEILGMGEGTIIELDKLAGEPVDILVNHKLIAKGEVVVIDENFGVRVTEIVSQIERVSDLG